MANLKPRKRGRGAAHTVPDRVEEHPVQHQNPGSLVELPLEAVRRYRLRYNLPIATPATFPGFLLGGPVGKMSSAHAKYKRSSYQAAHRVVTDHLNDGIVKESDTIAEFLYTVQHKDQALKLRFGKDDRRALNQGSTAYNDGAVANGASHSTDAMVITPTSTDLHTPQHQPTHQSQTDTHIPLPVEPLSARSNPTDEFTTVTVHG